MIFRETTFQLKDGRNAVLRSPCESDAEEMLGYIVRASGETDFLVHYPEEYSGMSVVREEKWINARISSPYALPICCVLEGKIVGMCELRFNSAIKASHRVSLAITVQKAYWSLGIGSFMFEEMIAAASRRGAEIMELEFVEGNDRARRLYEKFGFRVVSEKPNAFKLKDGRYLGEFYMQKYL